MRACVRECVLFVFVFVSAFRLFFLFSLLLGGGGSFFCLFLVCFASGECFLHVHVEYTGSVDHPGPRPFVAVIQTFRYSYRGPRNPVTPKGNHWLARCQKPTVALIAAAE